MRSDYRPGVSPQLLGLLIVALTAGLTGMLIGAVIAVLLVS